MSAFGGLLYCVTADGALSKMSGLRNIEVFAIQVCKLVRFQRNLFGTER